MTKKTNKVTQQQPTFVKLTALRDNRVPFKGAVLNKSESIKVHVDKIPNIVKIVNGTPVLEPGLDVVYKVEIAT